jgi:hypothetical protein
VVDARRKGEVIGSIPIMGSTVPAAAFPDKEPVGGN